MPDLAFYTGQCHDFIAGPRHNRTRIPMQEQSTHCVSPAVAEKDKILQQNSLCTFPLHRIMPKHENSPKETRLEPGYNIARAHRAMQVASLHRCLHCQSAATDATVIQCLQCLCLPLLLVDNLDGPGTT